MELVSPTMCSPWCLFSVIFKILGLFLSLVSLRSSLCLYSCTVSQWFIRGCTQSLLANKLSIVYYWFCVWVHSKLQDFLSYPSVNFLLGSLASTLHRCIISQLARDIWICGTLFGLTCACRMKAAKNVWRYLQLSHI